MIWYFLKNLCSFWIGFLRMFQNSCFFVSLFFFIENVVFFVWDVFFCIVFLTILET